MAQTDALITDPAVIAKVQRELWRAEARAAAHLEHADLDAMEIERLTWTRWRFERQGGVAAVVRGGGRR